MQVLAEAKGAEGGSVAKLQELEFTHTEIFTACPNTVPFAVEYSCLIDLTGPKKALVDVSYGSEGGANRSEH